MTSSSSSSASNQDSLSTNPNPTRSVPVSRKRKHSNSTNTPINRLASGNPIFRDQEEDSEEEEEDAGRKKKSKLPPQNSSSNSSNITSIEESYGSISNSGVNRASSRKDEKGGGGSVATGSRESYQGGEVVDRMEGSMDLDGDENESSASLDGGNGKGKGRAVERGGGNRHDGRNLDDALDNGNPQTFHANSLQDSSSNQLGTQSASIQLSSTHSSSAQPSSIQLKPEGAAAPAAKPSQPGFKKEPVQYKNVPTDPNARQVWDYVGTKTFNAVDVRNATGLSSDVLRRVMQDDEDLVKSKQSFHVVHGGGRNKYSTGTICRKEHSKHRTLDQTIFKAKATSSKSVSAIIASSSSSSQSSNPFKSLDKGGGSFSGTPSNPGRRDLDSLGPFDPSTRAANTSSSNRKATGSSSNTSPSDLSARKLPLVNLSSSADPDGDGSDVEMQDETTDAENSKRISSSNNVGPLSLVRAARQPSSSAQMEALVAAHSGSAVGSGATALGGPALARENVEKTPTGTTSAISTRTTGGADAGGSANEVDLPPGWQSRISRTTGEVYYLNHDLQITTYTRPSDYNQEPLPFGWRLTASRNTGELYYLNDVTGESSWTRPSGNLTPIAHANNARDSVPVADGFLGNNGDASVPKMALPGLNSASTMTSRSTDSSNATGRPPSTSTFALPNFQKKARVDRAGPGGKDSTSLESTSADSFSLGAGPAFVGSAAAGKGTSARLPTGEALEEKARISSSSKQQNSDSFPTSSNSAFGQSSSRTKFSSRDSHSSRDDFEMQDLTVVEKSSSNEISSSINFGASSRKKPIAASSSSMAKKEGKKKQPSMELFPGGSGSAQATSNSKSSTSKSEATKGSKSSKKSQGQGKESKTSKKRKVEELDEEAGQSNDKSSKFHPKRYPVKSENKELMIQMLNERGIESLDRSDLSNQTIFGHHMIALGFPKSKTRQTAKELLEIYQNISKDKFAGYTPISDQEVRGVVRAIEMTNSVFGKDPTVKGGPAKNQPLYFLKGPVANELKTGSSGAASGTDAGASKSTASPSKSVAPTPKPIAAAGSVAFGSGSGSILSKEDRWKFPEEALVKGKLVQQLRMGIKETVPHSRKEFSPFPSDVGLPLATKMVPKLRAESEVSGGDLLTFARNNLSSSGQAYLPEKQSLPFAMSELLGNDSIIYKRSTFGGEHGVYRLQPYLDLPKLQASKDSISSDPSPPTHQINLTFPDGKKTVIKITEDLLNHPEAMIRVSKDIQEAGRSLVERFHPEQESRPFSNHQDSVLLDEECFILVLILLAGFPDSVRRRILHGGLSAAGIGGGTIREFCENATWIIKGRYVSYGYKWLQPQINVITPGFKEQIQHAHSFAGPPDQLPLLSSLLLHQLNLLETSTGRAVESVASIDMRLPQVIAECAAECEKLLAREYELKQHQLKNEATRERNVVRLARKAARLERKTSRVISG